MKAAPLKRPYSRPLFKKLFPEIRTTKNYRSTKCRNIQELQLTFQAKAIRNLSSYELSPNESEVLLLGLNFVLTPSASTHHLIQKSASRLTQAMNPKSQKQSPNYQASQILQTFHLGAP